MAYVILRAGGKQYKVAEGDVIDIAKLDAEAGQETTFFRHPFPRRRR